MIDRDRPRPSASSGRRCAASTALLHAGCHRLPHRPNACKRKLPEDHKRGDGRGAEEDPRGDPEEPVMEGGRAADVLCELLVLYESDG